MKKYKQLMLMVPGVIKQEDKMDFYRPLSVQGIYQTVDVVQKIKKASYDKPEFIFSSTSLYARQTAEIMHQTFPKTTIVFRDNLYAANEKNLLHFLTHLDDIFSCLLILTEAQAIQKLIFYLTEKQLVLKPSWCACIHWPASQSWKKIEKKSGQLIQLWQA